MSRKWNSSLICLGIQQAKSVSLIWGHWEERERGQRQQNSPFRKKVWSRKSFHCEPQEASSCEQASLSLFVELLDLTRPLGSRRGKLIEKLFYKSKRVCGCTPPMGCKGGGGWRMYLSSPFCTVCVSVHLSTCMVSMNSFSSRLTIFLRVARLLF